MKIADKGEGGWVEKPGRTSRNSEGREEAMMSERDLRRVRVNTKSHSDMLTLKGCCCYVLVNNNN